VPIVTARRATYLIDKEGKVIEEQVDGDAVDPTKIVDACEFHAKKRRSDAPHPPLRGTFSRKRGEGHSRRSPREPLARTGHARRESPSPREAGRGWREAPGEGPSRRLHRRPDRNLP